MSKWKGITKSDVNGYCANSECMNKLTTENEYLIDDFNLYCDSICYTSYMLKAGAVKEIKY